MVIIIIIIIIIIISLTWRVVEVMEEKSGDG
jgi:hypothetical protein